MKEDTKGLYLAVILSIVVIYATNLLFPAAPEPAAETTAVKEKIAEEALLSKTEIKPAPAEKAAEKKQLTTEQALAQNPRIAIKNNVISGSIRLQGARFDDIVLDKYKQTLSPDSKNIELLSPAQTAHPYYAEFGWLSGSDSTPLPSGKTLWTSKSAGLSPETPLILEWNNGKGLRFIRKITLDENYMFTISDTVENNGRQNITLYPYGLISRTGDFETSSASVVHEGMTGVLNETLQEEKYNDLDKGEQKEFHTSGGWAGFSDRYWFSAFILDNQQETTVKYRNTDGSSYQVDFLGQPLNIAAGSAGTYSVKMFAGAKEIKLLDKYAGQLNIPKFDLAVDFGWYYFLTKPFFYILDFLYNFIGNMGWAILLFAALLRLVMFPIANKSYESMSKMKKLQPKIKTLQERYGDDKMKLQQETMALYRKEKINPAAGCLPLLIQIPVFFSLYKVLNIAIEIRHAPFIGWIKDLSAPDPLTLSVITHLPVPVLLDIGVWPIIMGITMYIQQKLNPAPTSKDQARMFALLPLIFTFMLGHFASGLVIYWTLSNILSIIQQKAIMKKNGI